MSMQEKKVEVIRHKYYDDFYEVQTEVWGAFPNYDDWKAVEKEVTPFAIELIEYFKYKCCEDEDEDGIEESLAECAEKIENEYAKAWYIHKIKSKGLAELFEMFKSLYTYQQGMEKRGFCKEHDFSCDTVYYLTLDCIGDNKKRQRVE